jgi:hypothetical protein
MRETSSTVIIPPTFVPSCVAPKLFAGIEIVERISQFCSHRLIAALQLPRSVVASGWKYDHGDVLLGRVLLCCYPFADHSSPTLNTERISNLE